MIQPIMPQVTHTLSRMNRSLDSNAKHRGAPPSTVLPAREQTRFHPYSQSLITRGRLGFPTQFVSHDGRKEHPEWPYHEGQYEDVELRSSDKISFWVPSYILMAFSNAFLKRIQQETSRLHSASNVAQNEHISITLGLSHHRVLAAFLAFTQGRQDTKMYTAAQYWQCESFAHSHEAKHFKAFLAEKILPKVIKEDPMGTFAFACEMGQDALIKACFPHMGDHWSITVDIETGVASWSTYGKGVYSLDSPVRCADAFASKIGLSKFRAFMWACERALDLASASARASGVIGSRRVPGHLKIIYPSDGSGYYQVDDNELWEMIYQETVCHAALEGGNNIIAWIEDMEEESPGFSTSPNPQSDQARTALSHSPDNVTMADTLRDDQESSVGDRHSTVGLESGSGEDVLLGPRSGHELEEDEEMAAEQA